MSGCIPSRKAVDPHGEEKKNRYIPLSSTAAHSLVNRGSEYKTLVPHSFVFPFPHIRHPKQDFFSERKVKCPGIIRARHRRAGIFKCWCLSLSPRPRFSILSSQIHLVLAGGGETGVRYPPSFPPLDYRDRIRSLVMRSLSPHKLALSHGAHGAFKYASAGVRTRWDNTSDSVWTFVSSVHATNKRSYVKVPVALQFSLFCSCNFLHSFCFFTVFFREKTIGCKSQQHLKEHHLDKKHD